MCTHCYKIQLKKGSSDYTAGWMKGLYHPIYHVYEVLTGDVMATDSIYLEREQDNDYLIVCSNKEGIPRAGDILNSVTGAAREAAVDFIGRGWEDVIPLEHVFDKERVGFK